MACEFEQIAVFVHQNSFKSPLEQMACARVSSVGGLGAHTIESAHALGEVAVGCLHYHAVHGSSSGHAHGTPN
jgi:hypothetical protein